MTAWEALAAFLGFVTYGYFVARMGIRMGRKIMAEENWILGAKSAKDNPSPGGRFWAWLGFRKAHAEHLTLMAGFGFKYERFIQNTTLHFGWRDRLRVLVSGRCMVQIASHVECNPGASYSLADFGVLPPGTPVNMPTVATRQHDWEGQFQDGVDAGLKGFGAAASAPNSPFMGSVPTPVSLGASTPNKSLLGP